MPPSDAHQPQEPHITHTFMVYFRMHEDMYMQNWEASTLVDLTTNGCFFFSTFPYQENDTIDIRLQLPGQEKPIFLIASVQRIEKKNDHPGMVGVTVQFRDPEDTLQRTILKEAVKSFLAAHPSAAQTPEITKRIAPRINRSFITRFRAHTPDAAESWQTATLQNISATGCLFSCQQYYAPDALLDILIEFPGIDGPIAFIATVKRCQGKTLLNTVVYSIGVEFREIDQVKKDMFLQRLSFLVKIVYPDK